MPNTGDLIDLSPELRTHVDAFVHEAAKQDTGVIVVLVQHTNTGVRVCTQSSLLDCVGIASLLSYEAIRILEAHRAQPSCSKCAPKYLGSA